MFHFTEQYLRFHQQFFEQWTPFEQFYAIIESSKKLQLPHRYFLSRFLLHVNIEQESNEMFNHTVHQANTPAILACLLSDPLEKILSTLQLYLPLLSLTTTNDKLLDAYRDVLIYLDTKLENLMNVSQNEQQLIQSCQNIRYFIENNPSLHKFLNIIPQLTTLSTSSSSQTHQGGTDEQNLSMIQRHQPLLQRFPSGRCYSNSSNPLANKNPESCTSSSSSNTIFAQQLIRKDVSDSGVDLSESGMNNSVQNLLPHCLVSRSNLTLPNSQENISGHPFVSKTTSSPIPEQTLGNSNRTNFVPLSAVLSAPAPSIHSFYPDYRSNNSNFGQTQIKGPMTISDEDENENHLQTNYLDNGSSRPIEMFLSEINPIETNRRLVQFRSLRNRNSRIYGQQRTNHNESVSPYLAIDSNTDSVRNTFIQPNSGMRDVPKWLKNLRLHKYAFFFSQMSYDQMMNLTIEKLKEGKITDGACTKILINIKKLKERGINLKKLVEELEHEQIDLKVVVQQLHEFMLTPIRAKQNVENENDDEEDLPALIMEVLEKVYQRLTSNICSTTVFSDMCNNLVGLFDRCYKHEAFSSSQRLTLLQWRGPLCTKLQTSGKIEFKSMQSSSTNRRLLIKTQSNIINSTSNNNNQINKNSVRNVKNNCFYPNFSLSRTNCDLSNVDCSTTNNIIRRPTKSPTLIFPNKIESNDDETNQLIQEQNSSNFLSDRSPFNGVNFRNSFQYLTSTPQRANNGFLSANQHQLLTRKTSVGPSPENSTEEKPKLCKTFSDPNRIRFQNPSNPNSNFSFENENSFLPRSTIEQNEKLSNSNDVVSSHENRQSNTEFDTFCRQITASALGDDVQDSSIEPNEEFSGVSQMQNSSSNSNDLER